jgi:hypothetical protein
MQSIKNCIEQQIEINKSKNLLYASVEQVIELDPNFLAALEELLGSASGDSLGCVPSDVVSLAVQALLTKLYSINPYLRISPGEVEELEAIYQETWQGMLRTRDIRATLRERHYPQLSRWLAAVYPKEFLKYLRTSPLVGRVVCEEYSAELQVELFQIEVSQMKQPVIDIGCGSHANLVRHLRSLGVEAYGFDRSLETYDGYLEQTDWFEYVFEPVRWGTVISNMAFTNHLNYAYRHDRAHLERYLLKMREVIESLAVGGRFYYAPGLPFVEQRLAPTQYGVERRCIMDDICVSTVTRLAD